MRILMVLNGIPPSKKLLSAETAQADMIVAVDGGINSLRKYHIEADLLMGDLDSALVGNMQSVRTIELSDQNLTDLQKTLHYLEMNYSLTSITLLGAQGQRSDHFLNNLNICASFDSTIPLCMKSDSETIHRITPDRPFDQRVGINKVISLIPYIDCQGVTSSGLKWYLNKEMTHSDQFSQSNRSTDDRVTVSLSSGILYLIINHPA